MEAALWYFVSYSFLGYLLEKGFAAWTGAENRVRQCFLLLPLCPVYGLGMLAVLALPSPLDAMPYLAAAGGAAATGVEYAVHWAYERLLGVRFWDYTGLPGNFRGRICLPFTLAWGVLSAAAAVWVQPLLEALVPWIPPAASWGMLVALTAETVCSARFLRVTGDVQMGRSGAV